MDGLENVRKVMAQAEDVDLPEELRAPDEDTPEGEPQEESGDAGEGEAEGDFAPHPALSEDAEPPKELICSAFPLNDYGNGCRFRTHFGEDIMWVPRVGWFTWSGQVWRKDPDEIEIRKAAQRLGGLIEAEVPWLALEAWQMDLLANERALRQELRDLEGKVGDDGRPDEEAARQVAKLETKIGGLVSLKKQLGAKRAEHRRFAKSSGNSGKISAAIQEAGVELAVPLEQLDAAALDINTENGVLRFGVDATDRGRYASVDLVAHDRAHRLSKIMPVLYDPEAEAPQFKAFLERVQPDLEMRGFLQRWCGLSMTGILVQYLSFWYGSGANGKSVLTDICARILGDYATTAKIESLTGKNKRGGGDATPDLVPLIGARMVRASEPDEGERLQEGLIKELTGGEAILVRALHSDFVEVRPQFKLTISGNHKPEIRGTDDGIWRRVLLVPFNVQIPEAERDLTLGEKLWEERSGILNWLVGGLLAYLENGLGVPDQVRSATQEYRQESDPVGAFLEACCEVTGDAGDTIAARELGEGFNIWLEDRGEGQWQPRTIAMRLKDKSRRWVSPTTGRGFVARKSSTMSYDGIRFNETFGQRFMEVWQAKRGGAGKAEEAATS